MQRRSAMTSQRHSAAPSQRGGAFTSTFVSDPGESERLSAE